MKRRISNACVICVFQSALLFGGLNPLFSQQVYSRIDSSITYDYRSGPDSIFLKKELICQFDSVSKNFQSRSYNWNVESELWEPVLKYESEESEHGDVISSLSYSGDPITGEWNLAVWQKLFMDSCGNVTSFVNYVQPTDEDQWLFIDSLSTVFDGTGNEILSESFRWDYSTGVFLPRYKFEYQTNSEGDRVLQTKYTWSSGGTWVLFSSEKNEYAYDTDGKIVSLTTSLWDKGSEVWRRSAKLERDYNALELSMAEILYEPLAGEVWRAIHKIVYTHDSSGNIIQRKKSTNTGTYPELNWIYNYKNVYRYNYLGIQELNLQYNYYPLLAEWAFKRSEEKFYNNCGLNTMTIISASNEVGTDSLVSTIEYFFPGNEYYTTYDSICEGDESLWRGSSYTSAGRFHEEFVSCMGMDSIYTLNLRVMLRPEAFEIMDIEGNYMICQGQSVYYAAPQNPEVGYRWLSEGGEILTGGDKDTVYVQWVGDWDAKLEAWSVNTHGCTSDTALLSLEIAICDHVDELPASHCSIYPVPVRDRLYIQNLPPLCYVEVFDARGVSVFKSDQVHDGVDFSDLPEGVYLVRILDKEGKLLDSSSIVKTE